jgi:hypothetical protein
LKHPETAALARAAYDRSGAKNKDDFVALFPNDAIGVRTFHYWLAGERPPTPLAVLVLREVAAGWLPGRGREQDA